MDWACGSLESVAEEPYIHIKRVDGQLAWSGTRTCAVGHRISKAGDNVDDGVFAGWSWDGAVLRAYNDRYGLRALYYFSRGEEIVLSTSILRPIAEGAPAEFNYVGLAVFFRLGSFLAEDTPFRDIRALPPNAFFEWKNGILGVTGGMRHAKPQQLSRNAALDAYILLFRDPQPDTSYDVVMASRVLEHVIRRRFLKEIRRVLRRGGRAFIFVADDCLGPIAEPEHVFKYNGRSLRALVEDYFTVVSLVSMRDAKPHDADRICPC